jgi:NCAIR mutase (PurE)-related protein
MGLTEHGIRLDEEREARLGFDEAIYAAGKSTEQLDALVADALARGQRRFFTRLSVEQAALLRAEHRAALDHDPISRTAVVGTPRPLAARVSVGVLAAGSSDLPVASEARRTLEYHGQAALQVSDVGVAGLWRLLERLDELRRLPILIVAAGMEGALFSVVGGLLPGAVIALPTSVGYGVSAGGRTALGSALASCAPGIVAVNIDNGYGAACAALRMLRAAAPA